MLGVSTSGFYEWLQRKSHPFGEDPSQRRAPDKIKRIHAPSRHTVPRASMQSFDWVKASASGASGWPGS